MSDAQAQVTRAQEDDGRPAAQLIADYRQGPARLRKAFEGMDAEAMRARPIAGKMSSLEVLCHVADCEQFLADRMKRTIATDLPLLVGVNGIAYLDALHYADRDLELDFALLAATRAQMAADLERIDAAGWERAAIHTEVGRATLRGLLLHAIRHLERHVDAIAEKRVALGLE